MDSLPQVASVARGQHARGVWTPRNTTIAGKRLWTTRVLGRWTRPLVGAIIVASALLSSPPHASADTTQAPSLDLPSLGPKTTEPVAVRTNEPPSPEATLAAFGIVERWVRAWSTPPASEIKESLPRTTAACVTLRMDGRLLARAEAVAPQTSGLDAGSTDLVRLAAERAIKAATPRLNVPNDALRDQAILEAAKRITISLELAGPFVALEPATWGDVDAELAPGLDGVSVRVAGANTDSAIVFPSTMLAAGMIPSAGMKACVSEVVGEGGAAVALEEPKKLKAERKLEFRRFRVTHVAQVSPSRSATVLHRGAEMLPAGAAMNRDELVRMAQRLADNIVARAIRADGEMRPLTPEQRTDLTWLTSVTLRLGDSRGGLVPDTEAALAALALRSSSKVSPTGGWLVAQQLLADIVLRANAQSLESPDLAALFWAANRDELNSRDPEWDSEWALKRSLGDNRVHPKVDDWSPDAASSSLPVGGFAVLAAMNREGGWVLYSIRESAQRGAIERRDIGERQLLPLLTRAQEAGLANAMPALGWAALEVALAREDIRQFDPPPTKDNGNEVLARGEEVPGAIAFRQMREQIWKHQLTLSDAGPDNLDMVGGIVFTSGLAQGKGNPYPTWQCVRPLAFVATMLRDKRLTEPQERSAEIVRLMQAARFLRQLQVDESNAWMYSDPQQALGAIRASVWDKSTPIDATSLTLMFVTELIKSLDALAKEK